MRVISEVRIFELSVPGPVGTTVVYDLEYMWCWKGFTFSHTEKNPGDFI